MSPDPQPGTGYWNHNSAYHRWICAIAGRQRGSVLDVGCGEGLLLQRLSEVSESVVGIDPDPAAVERARQRVASMGNVTVLQTGFMEYACPPAQYDLVTFVASLHHLDLSQALLRARLLLRPGGEIIIVGVAANKGALDWIRSGARVPLVRLSGWRHREIRDVGVVTATPKECLAEIREVVQRELPAARIRRGLYYRYLLRWRQS